MTVILGGEPDRPGVDPTDLPWARELSALRAYRDDVRRVRSEPGHVTKSELDEIERHYQEKVSR